MPQLCPPSVPSVALMMKEPHLGRILDGSKTWELRGSRTRRRGPITLARSGSGLIIGSVTILDVLGPLTLDEMLMSDCLPLPQRQELEVQGVEPYRSLVGGVWKSRTFAWKLADPIRFDRPLNYRHPQGAVIFVNLAGRL